MNTNNGEKGIDENMSIGELAIMINRSFNIVFDELREVKQDIKVLKQDVAELKKDVANLEISVSRLDVRLTAVETRLSHVETRLSHVEKKVDLMDKNMVSRYEFTSLTLRTEKVEELLHV